MLQPEDSLEHVTHVLRSLHLLLKIQNTKRLGAWIYTYSFIVALNVMHEYNHHNEDERNMIDWP